jgi:hypothetical protein
MYFYGCSTEATSVPGKYTTYTIMILSEGGGIHGAMDLICGSDHDIRLVAQLIRRPHGLEIWDGERLVALFPPANAKAA